MNTKPVLVVEDEKDLSDIVVQILDVFGLKGEVAESAAVAEKFMDENQFQFVIIDLTLPDKSGTELFNDISTKFPEYKNKVVFTSGYSVPEELQEIIKTHNLEFLPKPYSLDKFKEVIDTFK